MNNSSSKCIEWCVNVFFNAELGGERPEENIPLIIHRIGSLRKHLWGYFIQQSLFFSYSDCIPMLLC